MTVRLSAVSLLVVLGFCPALVEQFETPKAEVVCVLGATALGAVAMRGLRRGITLLDAAILFALAVEVICTVTSTAPALSLHGDPHQREGLLTAIGLAGLFAGASRFPDAARRAIDVFVIASAVACAYALVQAAGFELLRWEHTASYGAELVRPFGTLGHPNLLGVISAATSSLTLARALAEPARRWLYAPATALFWAATVLTLSRGAWLAALSGAAVVLVGWWISRAHDTGSWRVRWPWLFLAAGVALVLLALVAASGWGTLLLARGRDLLSPTSGSAASRLEIWKAAIAAWHAHPWIGHGSDTFALIFPQYQTPDYWRLEWSGLPNHAHSVVLQSLATHGVLGGLAMVGCVAAFVTTVRRAWLRSPLAAVEIAGIVVAVSVAGLFGAFGIAGWTLLVLGTARVATLADPEPAAVAPESRVALIVATLAGVAMLAFTANPLMASWEAAVAMREMTVAPARAVAAATAAVWHAPWDDEMHRLLGEALLEQASRGRERDALLERAAASVHEAVRRSPSRVLNWQRLGTIEMARAEAGDPAARVRGESAYARSLLLSPQNTLALLELARAQLQLRRFDPAREAAQRAADLVPNDAIAVVSLGYIALNRGDAATARAAFSRALALDWHGRDELRAAAQTTLASLR